MSNTIHPNDLTPAHVNRQAIVTLPDRTEVRGPLGPYRHEIKWISDLHLCDMRPMHQAGPTVTEFTVGSVKAVAETGDGATIALLDETGASA